MRTTRRVSGRVRPLIAAILVLAVACAECLGAEPDHWDRIRYCAGPIKARVDPFEWDNSIRVRPDAIVLDLEDRQVIRIPTAKVTAISYGRKARLRVADTLALSLIVSPLALFGLLHKSKLHFIGIEYHDADGKPMAVLIQGHKDNYRAILKALEKVTGKSVDTTP